MTRAQSVRRSSPGGGVIWDLAFLPDGSSLLTVRAGEVRKWTPGEPTSTLVANQSSAGSPLAGLFAEGQSCLMGVAVDPAFSTNRGVSLYFSHKAGGANRVVRYRLTESNTLDARSDLVTGISYKAAGTKRRRAGLALGRAAALRPCVSGYCRGPCPKPNPC